MDSSSNPDRDPRKETNEGRKEGREGREGRERSIEGPGKDT